MHIFSYREPPERLKESVIAHVHQRQYALYRRLRWQKALLLPASLLSLGSTLYFLAAFLNSMLSGEVSGFVSLLFSDTSTAIFALRELALSIVEATPFETLTLALITAAVFIYATRKLVTTPAKLTLNYHGA